MITTSKQISPHFHSTEFRCQHCNNIKIDENLVDKMEHIFSKLNASKCIISSGYRCAYYDKLIGGFLGKHYEGLAADCCYYDSEGKIIPSEIVICVAYDLGELNGMAKIDSNYVHLDNRSNGTYRGDETRGNSSYWSNPYDYFGVSKADVAKYTGEVVTEDVNVFYRVRTQKHGWLPEVKNLTDYAGYEDSPITDVAIRVDKGSVWYQVHNKGGEWLPKVTGYDINESSNGYAGDGKVIDAIRVYYNTPDDIRPYKKVKYRINGLPWMYDNEKDASGDDFAGIMGQDAYRLEIIIE